MNQTIEFIVPVALIDVFKAIAPQYETETGHTFNVVTMLNPEVPAYIAQGAEWCIAASNPTYIEQIIATGRSAPDMWQLGWSPLAFATRDQNGDPCRSVSEIATFLQRADSIAVTQAGTSGSQFSQLLHTLGLHDHLEPRIQPMPGGGPMGALLDGAVDVAALPLTNIAPIKGVAAAAVCPHDLGVHIDLALCVNLNANLAARTFANWIMQDAQTSRLRELGLFRSGPDGSDI